MSASPTALMEQLPARKALRLRSSCEGCGSAKVKCNRGQPTCSRCATLSLTCVYGISRRFGKPPRKRPSAHFHAPDSFSHRKYTARSTRSCENHMATVLERSQGVSNPVQLNFSDTVAANPPLPSGHNAGASVENRDELTTMGVRKPESANEAAQLNFSDPRTDVFPVPSSMNAMSNIYEQNRPCLPVIPQLSLDEWPQFNIWDTDLEFPSFSRGLGLESQISASVKEPANNLSASFDSPEFHSCPRGSYELFRDLICPSPFLHAPEAHSDTVSARLDEVLHFNSEAIDRLSRLLKCPCAKSGHRIMVHASIVSRILIWYQQAAGWNGSSSWESRPSSPTVSSPSDGSSPSSLSSSIAVADTDTASLPTLVQSTGFAVDQVPVSVGIFNIEDQNVQDAFRTQLVLSELKKAATVIDLFITQDSSKSSASSAASLRSHLGGWLQSEHFRTVMMLRARIRALNQSLDN